MHGIITDIGLTVIISAIVVILITRLKQPIILGYLITGVIIGPEIGANLMHDPENIEIISELGLVLLLFIIGLEMNPQQLIHSGRKIIIPGLLQFPISVAAGYFVYRLIQPRIDHLPALYLGILTSLSSTAIVVKLLYDKLEIDTLYGRISVGILIFQDIWAIIVIAIQPHLHDPQIMTVIIAIGKGFLLLGIGFLFSRYVLKTVFEGIHKNPEMTVIVSIAWCAILAAIANLIELSTEMGALIAGISISTFPYSIHVTSRITILRDFFLSLFFVSLGMKIPMPQMGFVPVILGILGLLAVTRAATIIPLMLVSGSSLRTAAATTMTLTQISEFSLVIAAIGISHNHMDRNLFSAVLYTMSVTAILSSYSIKFNYQIISFLYRLFRVKEDHGDDEKEKGGYSIVVLGCHRGAREMLEILSDVKPNILENVLVIDYNMESLKELQGKQIGTLFGDISSLDTLKHANIEHAKYIVSSIPDMLLKGVTNEQIIKMCVSLAPDAVIVATAESDHQAMALKKAGAGKVMMPYTLIGDSLANYILLENEKN